VPRATGIPSTAVASNEGGSINETDVAVPVTVCRSVITKASSEEGPQFAVPRVSRFTQIRSKLSMENPRRRPLMIAHHWLLHSQPVREGALRGLSAEEASADDPSQVAPPSFDCRVRVIESELCKYILSSSHINAPSLSALGPIMGYHRLHAPRTYHEELSAIGRVPFRFLGNRGHVDERL
jgi:hypothetical protein